MVDEQRARTTGAEDFPITVYTKDVVLWRDYVDARFNDRDNHVDDRFQDALRAIEAVERLQVERVASIRQEAKLQHAGTEQAIAVAQAANEKRFTSIEDLRGMLNRYMPRGEFDTSMQAVNAQLGDLAQLKANERLQIERVDSLRRETEALRIGSEQAIAKSDAATEKRFASVNEFRAQLNDQAATFMPRRESEANWHRASDAIEAITKQQANMTTRGEITTTIGALTDRVNELTLRITRAEGQDAGSDMTAQLAAIKNQIDTNSAAIITSAGVKQGGVESKAGMYALLAAIAAIVVVVNVIIALATK